MTVNLVRTICSAFALLFLSGLSACAGYDVLQASGQPASPLEKSSLHIFWKNGKFVRSVEAHQRLMRGAVPGPAITQEDNVLYSAKADLVKLNLQRNLVDRISSGLAPYVSREKAARNALMLELARIAADTDGSRSVTISASLFQTSEGEKIWARTVKVSAPRFSSDDAISNEVATAIIEQLKSSALIE